MGKKLVFVLLIILCLSGISFAAIKDTTDLALSKPVVGTFSNPSTVTDGIANVKKVAAATSNRVADSDQFLTVDIGKLVYADRIKVHFDAAAYPRSFAIRTSSDGKYWEVEAANIDAATGALDKAAGTVSLSISCKRAMIGARYLQVYVPAGTASSSGDRIKIAEIEVFPAMGQALSITSKSAYAVADNNAVISYRTNIGAVSGKVAFGMDPTNLNMTAPNQESGVDNSATLYGLKPGAVYYYRVEATDLYGKTAVSDMGSFSTLNTNVALKKPVSGTFTELPPLDPFVEKTKPVLSRVTDGSTSYFNAMATSSSLYDSDQYVVIDLGDNYSIKNIQTYWRRLAYPEDYSVFVSADGSSWRSVAEGLNAGSGAFSRSDAGDPMQVVSTPVGDGAARYVKVLVGKGAPFFHKHSDWNFVQLMEVKVFSD